MPLQRLKPRSKHRGAVLLAVAIATIVFIASEHGISVIDKQEHFRDVDAFALPTPASRPRRQADQRSRDHLSRGQQQLHVRKLLPKEREMTTTIKDNDTDNSCLVLGLPKLNAIVSKAFCAAAASTLLLLGTSSPAMAAASPETVVVPEYISISERDIQIENNKKLVDYAIGTVNTQFYDSSGGARFNPSDFYRQWKDVQKQLLTISAESSEDSKKAMPLSNDLTLDTRDGTVETLKYLVSSLKDPYSKYMTREELQYEYKGTHQGFLGTGAYIEIPSSPQPSFSSSSPIAATTPSTIGSSDKASSTSSSSSKKSKQLLTNTKVANLPVVTAIAPNSPAERAGLVVGDKIVGVGDVDNFLGYGRSEIRKCLSKKWGYSDASTKLKKEEPSRYFGVADLTIAKPVYSYNGEEREIVLGYRSTKVKLPTIATDVSPKIMVGSAASDSSSSNSNPKSLLRGDAIVQYDMFPSYDFNMDGSSYNENDIMGSSKSSSSSSSKVGYIRLTRFSKSSTEGYLNAVQTLEDEGAQSYVIDLRNNYGGVIQEAMLTASTLLGDPHAILCYLLNARGGFTPVDVESYVVDPRYPGYLLSKESKASVLEQMMKENPKMFKTVAVNDGSGIGSDDVLLKAAAGYGITSSGSSSNQKKLVAMWDPPSSYASIHEQVTKRGIHRISFSNFDPSNNNSGEFPAAAPYDGATATTTVSASNSKMSSNGSNLNSVINRQRMLQQKMLQKDVVLLINEGTASSSEFFAAALQDNGRSLAVVGTKSFGKGLIQHTFPMPDGGGLKLTIGEFLRPSLKHVTNVFDVGFVDKASGEIVGGGGVNPDVYCDSRQGIPSNPRADLCVKVALDVLEEHQSSSRMGSFGVEAAMSTEAVATNNR